MSRPLLLAVWMAVLAVLPASGLQAQEDEAHQWVPPTSIRGMTGLVNTPTADVLPPDALRFGLILVDKQWTFNTRNQSDSHHYFLTVGFIPRLELSFRVTYSPDGVLSSDQDEPGAADRGGSARLLALTEGKIRPAVAVGIDDVRGTRRFHSLYIVGSKWVTGSDRKLKLRVSAGYASDALSTNHERVLDGVFGGGELVYSNFLSGALDFDSEKWNTSIRLIVVRRLAAHFALLNFEAPAGGLTWTQRF